MVVVLRMFDLKEFVGEIKRRGVKEVVGVAIRNKYLQNDFVKSEVVATTFDKESDVILEYVHCEKTYFIYDEEERRSVEGLKDDLKWLLSDRNLRVVSGAFLKD